MFRCLPILFCLICVALPVLPDGSTPANAAEETAGNVAGDTQPAISICVRTSPPGASVRTSGGDSCTATPCRVGGGRRDVLVMRKYGYRVARVAVTPETNGVYAKLKKAPAEDRPGPQTDKDTDTNTDKDMSAATEPREKSGTEPAPHPHAHTQGTVTAQVRDAASRPPNLRADTCE